MGKELTALVKVWVTQERVDTAKSALLAETKIGESYSLNDLHLKIAPKLGIEFVDAQGNINPKIKGAEFVTYLALQRLAYEGAFSIKENKKDKYVRIGHA